MEGMMKTALFLLALLLISGCFVVVKDQDKVKVFGNRQEVALDTLEKIEETEPEEKQEVWQYRK